MGRIFTKTVNGRKYRYERLSTTRVGKKVITKDKYLGAVVPVQGKMKELSSAERLTMKKFWGKGSSEDVLVEAMRGYTGKKYAGNTVTKWCRAQFGKKGGK